jgi:hypothetical protein
MAGVLRLSLILYLHSTIRLFGIIFNWTGRQIYKFTFGTTVPTITDPITISLSNTTKISLKIAVSLQLWHEGEPLKCEELLYSGMLRPVVRYIINVSKERTASTFRVEQYAKQQTGSNLISTRWLILLDYSLILKTEVVRSSETSVNFCRTAWNLI